MTHKLTVTVDIHEFGDARIGARSSKLGLTAYGSTKQEAIDTYRQKSDDRRPRSQGERRGHRKLP